MRDFKEIGGVSVAPLKPSLYVHQS